MQLKASFDIGVTTPLDLEKLWSEVEKHARQILRYTLRDGTPAPGLDVGSQGVACVPWAWGLDLPMDKYLKYNGTDNAAGPIQLRGDACSLPVETGSLWFVCVSHLLEDFPKSKWCGLFTEWARPLMSGGHLIILVPDHDLWWKYVKSGGIHNIAHVQPQPKVGDMSKVATSIGLNVIAEQLTNDYPGDYSIIGVFRKP